MKSVVCLICCFDVDLVDWSGACSGWVPSREVNELNEWVLSISCEVSGSRCWVSGDWVDLGSRSVEDEIVNTISTSIVAVSKACACSVGWNLVLCNDFLSRTYPALD